MGHTTPAVDVWACELHSDTCLGLLADFLKLNFPAAFSASLLAWGLIEFPDVSLPTDNAMTTQI